MVITGNRNFNFTIAAPPSKSVYHRELIVRFLCGDRAHLTESDGDNEDIRATKACLRALSGAVNGLDNASDLADFPAATAASSVKTIILPCNESGSTIRFMIPVACAFLLREGLNYGIKELVFTTNGRLFDRPVKELSDALSPMGITISKDDSDRTIHVYGCMKGGDFTIDGSVSSQYISGLLMALPLYSLPCRIHVSGECKSVHYIELTLDALNKYGCPVSFENNTYTLPALGYQNEGAREGIAKDFSVEGDWSNGAFLLCMKEWSDIRVTNLNPDSKQGDRAILEFLSLVKDSEAHPEVTWDCKDIPDIVPYMAMVAPFSFGKTTFTGISRLRIKESDRVTAIRNQLNAVGIQTEESEDTLTIYEYESPRADLPKEPVKLSSYHDHRMAMSAVLLAVILHIRVEIDDINCLKKSFPEFLNTVIPKYFEEP